MINIYNFRGELADNSAKKEALVDIVPLTRDGVRKQTSSGPFELIGLLANYVVKT